MDTALFDVLDHVSEGIAILDSNLDIRYANLSFHMMMGLYPQFGPGHAEGRWEKGDIIILACNQIEMEEHMLFIEDLQYIGVDARDIKPGEGIIAIGVLGGEIGSAFVKIIPSRKTCFVEQMEYQLDGKTHILVQINDMEHELNVYINHEKIMLKYQFYNALCVALEKTSHTLKFYQSRGYTLRKENFSDLVQGRHYAEKNNIKTELQLCAGKNFRDLHPEAECVRAAQKVLTGKTNGIEGIPFIFNFLSYNVSIYQQKDKHGQVQGCIAIFKNMTAVKQLQDKILAEDKEKQSFVDIVGTSKEIHHSITLAKKIAKSTSTVLILGESGTGKGLFAKAIHENSHRASRPFIPVNMAAIPENLMESELFGYVKGAFTGASDKGSIGKFQAAENGTLFLDEIGELDINLQSKLLQAVQEGIIYPVGSATPIEVDIRLIAATNKDLEEEVECGRFRKDLYYRLNVITLDMIPLRHRKEDIRPLVEYILPKVSQKIEKRVTEIDADVWNVFYLYDWPGNVRELENILESAANLTEDSMIHMEDLPKRITNEVNHKFTANNTIATIKDISSNAEKEMIANILSITRGNKTDAAKMLNISRSSLYNKINKYQL